MAKHLGIELNTLTTETDLTMLKIIKLILISLVVILISACSTSTIPNLTGISLSKTPLQGKFIWHDLISTDLQADKKFFRSLFGWTFEEHDGPDGGIYTLAKSNSQYVAGLVSVDKQNEVENVSRWIGYLSALNVDKAVNMNAAAGGKIVVSPRDLDIGRVAAITDPQGAILGIVRSKYGDPDDTMRNVPGQAVWDELLSNDVTASISFYQKLMSYEVKTVNRRGGTYTLLMDSDVRRAGILKNPSDKGQTMWLTYFAVADVYKVVDNVEPLGGKVILAPSQDLREGSMALVTTPSGAIFAIQSGYCNAGESTC
jgi:uncharacterized protein